MVNLQSWFEFLHQWYFEKFCVSILTASWAAWIASFWSLNFWFTSLVEECYKYLVNRGCATIPCSSKNVRNRRAQMVAIRECAQLQWKCVSQNVECLSQTLYSLDLFTITEMNILVTIDWNLESIKVSRKSGEFSGDFVQKYYLRRNIIQSAVIKLS
jgi:hypothetical protein